MNKSEKKAFDWLIGKEYSEKDIVFQARRHPDFITSNGKYFEVKRLYGEGTIMFSKGQIDKLKELGNVTILVFSDEEDPIAQIPIDKVEKDRIVDGIRCYEVKPVEGRDEYQVAGKISRSTYMKIKRLIDAGMFLNFSDFTRKAIENELERLGETEILSIRGASVEEARRLIEEYLEKHQGPVYPSDIADHYGLELEPVFEAVKQLKAEGKVKETE